MVWQRKGRVTFECYVRPLVGDRVVASCGTSSKEQADRIEAWAEDITARGDLLGVLAAIATRVLTLKDAYHRGERGAAERLTELAAIAADVKLAPLLTTWEAWRLQRAKGRGSVSAYVKQIGVLFPEKVWLRSSLTPHSIGKRLDALTVTDSTRNRYRAALSAFCKWLVREGVLASNPARAVDGYSENPQVLVFYNPTDAQRVIDALPAFYRGREALMAGAGMDWSDLERLHVRDINLATLEVRCHGSKTPWRNRTVRITEDWTLPYVRAQLKGKLPDAPYCSGSERAALKWHYSAVAACGLAESTLHDWRHTYAVNALRRGESVSVVAHQLGHANPYLVWTRYGLHVPNYQDYQASKLSGMTTNVTTTHSQRG